MTRVPLLVGVSVVLIGAAIAVVTVRSPNWLRRGPVAGRPALQELARAVADRRPLEGRLTGGFKWGATDGRPRGAAADQPTTTLDTQLAAIRLAERARALPSPASLADHASGLLMVGDLDTAIDVLNESLEGDEAVAAHWSDLSAAHLARYTRAGFSTDLPIGLDAVERSLALAQLPEALFNRASILERLNLRDAARTAWQKYLEVDFDSPWADEARKHITSLDDQAKVAKAAAQVQTLREQLADDMLWKWATAPADAEGRMRLDEAQRADQTISDASPDRLAADLVKAIDDATGHRGTEAALRSAHRAYGNGRAAYKKDLIADAERELAVAERDAKLAGSPLQLLARLNRAIVRYRANDVPGAAALLTTIVRETPDAYPSLRGRALWVLGLLSAVRGNGRDASTQYRAALVALRESREAPNAAFVEMLNASQLDDVGDVEAAWQARISAFANTDRESPIQMAAIAASRTGWPRTASALYDIVSEMAQAQKRDIVMVEAIRGRARALALAGYFDAGLSVLEEAKRVAATHSEPNWDPIKAEIDLASAECLLRDSPAASVTAATRALAYFTAGKRDVRLPEVHLVRAMAYRALGQPEQAEADLAAGIAVMERSRQQLDEWRHRALMGDIVQRSGDEMVGLRIDAGRTEEAFDAAERLRAWELRTSAYGNRPAVTVSELTEKMPANTVMAWYFSAADETYLWAIERGRARFVQVPAGRRQLDRLVREHAAGNRVAAATLRHLLLEPIARELSAATRLVIVPDGPLHQLSFASLPGATARYLVEEHTVLLSPNATIFGDSTIGPVTAKATAPVALVVGNPTFDRAAFPSLGNLLESANEATDVAAFYGRRRLLVGPSALRGPILTELPHADVFHFAGHSVANKFAPGESRLIVTGSADQMITAAEISRLSLANLRLVVLSSCQSAVGPATRSEGPLGLAQAFLIAGVDTVMASLTLVNDRAARQLSVAFHLEFSRTGDAALSLQAAQRALIRSQDPTLSAPTAWGAFVVIGASSHQVD